MIHDRGAESAAAHEAPEPVLLGERKSTAARPFCVIVACVADFVIALILIVFMLFSLFFSGPGLAWSNTVTILVGVLALIYFWLAFDVRRQSRRAWQIQWIVSLPLLLVWPVGTFVYGPLLFFWFSTTTKAWFGVGPATTVTTPVRR